MANMSMSTNNSCIMASDLINIETRFQRHFFSNKETKSSKDDNSEIFISSGVFPFSILSLEDIFPNNCFNSSNENKPSSIEFPNFFKNKENDSDNMEEGGEILLGNKRLPNRRQRKDNKDNIRKKIKRGFFNNALVNKLNEILKKLKIRKIFKKFPTFFVTDKDRKRNKEMLNMTLKEIFEKKELYTHEKGNGFENYLHNYKTVQNEEIKKNEELKNILLKTFSELFEEYINSDEFNVEEINRLKKNGMEEDYIKRYIYISKHLIEFFSL